MTIQEKTKRKLRDRSGLAHTKTVALLLIFLMFLAMLMNFIRLYSMLMGITDYTQQAILQTATSNAYNAFGGVREGNSSAHQYAGSDVWNELVSTAELSDRLEDMLGMEKTGNSLYKYNDEGVMRYGISDIDIYCSNVAVGTGANDVTLTFVTKVTAEVPITFMGATLHVKKELSLKSFYTPRF